MTSGKTEKELLVWFEQDLLPRLIAENKFPLPGVEAKNLSQIGVDFEETGKGVDSFASTPYFLKLTLQDGTNPQRSGEFRLIIKFITQNLGCRAGMDTDLQFHNEMVFYNELLPAFQAYLNKCPKIDANFLKTIFPVCRYVHIDLNSPDYGIVIMDDLRSENFTLAASKVEIQLEYCQEAVKKLAKMHALSYAMKLDKHPGFHELRAKYHDCRFPDDRYKEESQDVFFRMTSCRAIDYLLAKKDSPVPESYLKMLKEKITPAPYKLIQGMMTPQEPIATICHGDFCRNNIMFRLENDKPVDVRLFDMATWRYGSPSIDLAFFTYMNTTLELREKHFDGLLSAYHKTLVETVSAMTSKSAAEIETVLPLELFAKDFGEKSLYGYMIAGFFLPMMMFPRVGYNFEDEWTTKSFQEMAEESAAHGGEIATKRLVEIIIDMYQRGYHMK